MSTLLVEKGKPAEDLGAILARVQDDLQLLRTTVARASDGAVDLDTLDSVLVRTERGVQAASEQVLSNDLDHVTTLPPVYNTEGSVKMKETPSRGRERRRRRRARSDSHGTGLMEIAECTSRMSPIHQSRVSCLTPGEESRAVQRARLVRQPALPATRRLLSQQYSLPPTPDTRSGRASKIVTGGKLYTGGTIAPLTTLPWKHRRNVMMTPPDISEEDVHRGLLSLIERQLIPPAADVILNPPPVKSTTLELLSASQQFIRPKIAVEDDVGGHMVGVKLAADHMTVTLPPTELRPPATPSQPTRQTCVNVRVIQAPDLPNQLPKQVQLRESPSSSRFTTSDPIQITVENGHTITNSQGYQQFQSSHALQWNHISSVLHLLETLCRNYAVPVATVNCGRLVELGCEYELGLRISREDLVNCLVNAKNVRKFITKPGQRFKGESGRDAAATLIQATYRMYCQRCVYLQHQRRLSAVRVISTTWTLFSKRCGVRVHLAKRRQRELKAHRRRTAELSRRWNTIHERKRVIIHLPSLGYPQCVRGTETAFSMEQSLQLARIADIKDPNVEVIYISPVTVDSEIEEYCASLLAMGPSGSKTAMKERVHIITPEHLHTFPTHNLPLSTILTLSPRTVQRIKRLIAGREAYIVPGLVNEDDITIADILGVPLLGPDSETSQLYSTKDGAKKIFTDANVPIPPYTCDVVSESQLMEQLAGLVVSHPLITRWIFKLPQQSRARGFAYCDVADHLQCYQWLVRERERYGDNWSTRWAQDQAKRRVLSELPRILESHATPVNSELYPTWRRFLADFLVSGGLIEGHPPSTSVTSLTVDLFIAPTGDISMLSTQDQICSESYVVWGGSVPQSSVPPETLINSVQQVGMACRGRGIVGHLSIDYVTFIRPKTLVQELWAVDLELGYSNHLALLRLLGYVTGATMEPGSGQLMVESGPRFAVLSPRVYHTNLPVIHYPVFFQMCKAHRIGYDAKENAGTLFALYDREHKENIGIICLQSNLAEALTCCSTALSTIHREISTPLMQGRSNFQAVRKELDTVAELVKENVDDDDRREDHGELTDTHVDMYN